jgi:hypothetical protein
VDRTSNKITENGSVMMARLGFYFQCVSVAVVFLAALACASGDTNTNPDATVTTGTGGVSGGPATGGTKAPTTGTGGVSQGDPPTNVGTGTGGTTEEQPPCGNGNIDDGEVCDGANLNGTTCESLMPGNIGDLSCEANCLNFNTSMCYPDDTDTPETDAAVDAYGL